MDLGGGSESEPFPESESNLKRLGLWELRLREPSLRASQLCRPGLSVWSRSGRPGMDAAGAHDRVGLAAAARARACRPWAARASRPVRPFGLPSRRGAAAAAPT